MTSTARRLWVRARLSAAARGDGEAGQLQLPQDRPRAFVFLAADYGNLGDLAITRAQLDFLAARLPGHAVVEIPISRTTSWLPRLRAEVRPDDVVTLVGGGNTGDLYDDIQHLRELVVRSFPGNPVISFPQSADFSATTYGRLALARARRVLASHPDVVLLARDSRTLAFFEEAFPGTRSGLAPDVVLTLDRAQPAAGRVGVLLALRVDAEMLTSGAVRSLVERLAGARDEVRRRDTHVGGARRGRAEADAELDRAWADFRAARLVVTDRLHGMIFALVTGTPCVALDSRTGKVGQFHADWLTGLASVRLVRSPDESALADAMDSLLATSSDVAAPELAAEFRERFDTACGPLLGSAGASP